ncbi:hypothetical protein [Maritalea sp.]|jgi:hypothetical protein|uniref:hypothetical protein n=1 Tax=Maritalea sp. TaxID=2003361 RepID=UPI0039E2271E
MAFSKRAWRVSELLDGFSGGATDFLEALVPLFAPLLLPFRGRLLNAELIAAAAVRAYGWNITSDVIEELAPRLVSAGYLKKMETNNKIAFEVLEFNDGSGSADDSYGDFETIISEFAAFAPTVSPLFEFNKTQSEYAEILTKWLVSVESYSNIEIRKNAQSQLKAAFDNGKEVSELDSIFALNADEKYICASFVEQLSRTNEHLFNALLPVVKIGLVAEVIEDLRSPESQKQKTGLTVILDTGPFLAFIGANGKLHKQNMTTTLRSLESIGGRLAVHAATLDEASRSLKTMLNLQAHERYGPTADALRRNEVSMKFVKSVRGNPENAAKQNGVSIITRKIDDFPNQHRYFDKSQYEAFIDDANWVESIDAKQHDALALATVVRMREDKRFPDLFEANYVFVTENAYFSSAAWKLQRDLDVVRRRHVSAVILRRQLATLVWLKTGAFSSNEIPRNILYAACSTILQTSKGVLEEVADIISGSSEADFEEYKTLMSDSRTARVVMNSTYGMQGMFGETDAPRLLKEMKESLIDDHVRYTNENQKKIEELHAEQIGAKRLEIAELRTQLESEREVVLTNANEEVDGVNREILVIRAVATALSLVVFGVGSFWPTLFGIGNIFVMVCFATLGIVSAYQVAATMLNFKLLKPARFLQGFWVNRANRRAQRFLGEKYSREFEINWEMGRVQGTVVSDSTEMLIENSEVRRKPQLDLLDGQD